MTLPLSLSLYLSLLQIYSSGSQAAISSCLFYKHNIKHTKDKMATETQEYGEQARRTSYKRWHLKQQQQQQQWVRYPCMPRITAIPGHQG